MMLGCPGDPFGEDRQRSALTLDSHNGFCLNGRGEWLNLASAAGASEDCDESNTVAGKEPMETVDGCFSTWKNKVGETLRAEACSLTGSDMEARLGWEASKLLEAMTEASSWVGKIPLPHKPAAAPHEAKRTSRDELSRRKQHATKCPTSSPGCCVNSIACVLGNASSQRLASVKDSCLAAQPSKNNKQDLAGLCRMSTPSEYHRSKRGTNDLNVLRASHCS